MGHGLEMNQILKFGPFEVDLAVRQLTQSGQPVPLTPKVFQTLEILVRNRDRVVSKRELLTTIWPECHVEEANLTQNISVLRKALGETSCPTKYIVTFPRQGYRFIGELAPEIDLAEAAVEIAAVPPRPARRSQLRYLWAAGILLPITVLGVSRLMRTDPPPETLGPMAAVTHLPGRAFQPVISPDGARLAFTLHQDMNGPLRIGVMDLSHASAPSMLATGEGDAFSAAWSPDGRRLAYLRAVGSGVSVALQSVDGTPEKLIEVFPQSSGVVARQIDWSPDGRFLAVSVKGAIDEPFRIELIHIAERRKTVLTTPPELSDGDFQPRFSPDGAKLAFVRQRSIGEMQPMYVPIPGGDAVAVSDSRDPCGDIDWTPDSQSVLFTPDHVGKSLLWEAPIHGRGNVTKREPAGALTDGLLQFSVSRRTGRLAMGRAETDQNIWRAALNGQHAIAGWERLVGSTGEDAYPTYSPDGRRIAFVSDRSGDSQIWIKEAGGAERQVTFGDLKPGAVSWTASGDTLVFPALRKRVLYRLPLNGSEPEAIPVGEVGSHTAVSPDGAWVFLVRRFIIMRAPASGGSPVTVTDRGGFPLRLSADGNWIYYVRHRFSSEIWRVRRADGFTERMTNRLWPGCWGCWSIDADSLVYIPIGGANGAGIERLDLTTRETSFVGALPGRILPPLGGMLTLSPDGGSLAAVVSEPGKGDIWTGALR